MKRIFYSLLIVFIATSVHGQVTLENTYTLTDNNGSNYNYNEISVGRFSSGDKYIIQEYQKNLITIYNLNHSIFKTINFPAVVAAGSYFDLINVSDKLINNDNALEVTGYYGSGTTINSIIFDENGSVIFQLDSAKFCGIVLNSQYTPAQDYMYFISTSNGTKTFLRSQKKYDKSIYVYSLPGSLVAGLSNPDLKNLPFNIYPNPADSYTKLDFEIENGQTGEITIYNNSGRVIKRYKVDNTFGSLLLNSDDLPSGEYLYQLATSKGSGTKKVIVIH